MQVLIDAIGYGLCHQLPARTFTAGNISYPVCARDTGLYFGIVASIAVLAFLYRGKDNSGFPSIGACVAAACLFATLAFDGLSSYLGFRETTNTLRFLSGTAGGSAAGLFLFWVVRNVGQAGREDERILGNFKEIIAWVCSVAILGALFLFGYPYLGPFGAVFITICMLSVIGGINAILLSISNLFPHPFATRKRAVVFFALVFSATCIELACLGVLRYLLVVLFSR
ncbi:MAG: DUF2085 domain-containing protein [Actinobacteria bacterium]|nr:DUF2085 domain-containing protein [Actinomycetota bacterium]